MVENLCYGIIWCGISTLAILKWGIITLLLLTVIQAIVYRTTKISIYKKLMKTLLK